MSDPARPSANQTGDDARSGRKAGFVGGLLAFVALVALSVTGTGHARTIEGAANLQYWIVVLLVAGALGFVTWSLAQTRATSTGGEMARKVGVVLGALWLAVFLWESVAVGSGAFPGPFELGWAAYKG